MSPPYPTDFEAVLAFHGHLCLDIAMGYRVARAALETLTDADPKRLTATVGNDTCAVDAIQALTGCTFGKRNLVPEPTGKPVYRWQDETGAGVRIYVHFWETFDTDGTFRATQRRAKGGDLDADATRDFTARHDALIDHILNAPEAELLRRTPLPPGTPRPPRSGGFDARPCTTCGEHTKVSQLVDGRCRECVERGMGGEKFPRKTEVIR